MNERINAMTMVLAARLMSCHFAGFDPGAVRKALETLTGKTCPWPVAERGYSTVGQIDCRLYYRPVGSKLDVVWLDDAGSRKVACCNWDDLYRAGEDFAEQEPPVPQAWQDYAELIKQRIGKEWRGTR